jgi:hypothetical protein
LRRMLVDITVFHSDMKWSSSVDRAMLASKGDSSPPTQLITSAST